MKSTQIVTYVEPLLKTELDKARVLVELRSGRKISESQFIAGILSRYISKR